MLWFCMLNTFLFFNFWQFYTYVESIMVTSNLHYPLLCPPLPLNPLFSPLFPVLLLWLKFFFFHQISLVRDSCMIVGLGILAWQWATHHWLHYWIKCSLGLHISPGIPDWNVLSVKHQPLEVGFSLCLSWMSSFLHVKILVPPQG